MADPSPPTEEPQSAAYYQKATDLVADTLRDATDEKLLEKRDKLMAILTNAVHYWRKDSDHLAALQQQITALQVELERSDESVTQDFADHWFLQGGKSQFGPLVDCHNADDVIAGILSVVRATVDQLEAQVVTLTTALRNKTDELARVENRIGRPATGSTAPTDRR